MISIFPRIRRLPIDVRLALLAIPLIFIGALAALPVFLGQLRQAWLQERLNNAHIAALALSALESDAAYARLRQTILRDAALDAISLKRGGRHYSIRQKPGLAPAAEIIRPAETGFIKSALAPAGDILRPPASLLRIHGRPVHAPEDEISIVLPNRLLRQALAEFAQAAAIMVLLAIAIATGLIMLSLRQFLRKPLRFLMADVRQLAAAPDDSRLLSPQPARQDEIGDAQVHLRRLQQAVQRALAQRERLAALGTAAARINHDLANILASAHLAASGLAVSGRREAKKIIRALDRARRLSQSVLDYASEAQAPPPRQKILLKPLAQEALASFAVDFAIADDFFLIAAADDCARILLNLVSNAAKACADKKEKGKKGKGKKEEGTIIVRARYDGAQAVIEVEDNGRGLALRARENLFQPFAGKAATGGTGLGLPIARELAKRNGGDLVLLHSGETGTVFRWTAPRG